MNYNVLGDVSRLVKTGNSFRIFHKVSSGYLCSKNNSEGRIPEVFIQQGNLTSNSL